MEKIIQGVQRLAMQELIHANEKKPLFASDHEAYGVLAEEVYETECECKQMCDWLEQFKIATFKDCDARTAVRKLRASAVLCAAEAIQVVAMCDKQVISKDE